MLKLNELTHFAEGAERQVYNHPENSSQCIKVNKHDSDADQNTVERLYYTILKYRGVNYHNVLPMFNGEIDTDRGKGLIFELVRDFDGNRSRTLADYIRDHLITFEQAEVLVANLASNLVSRSIIMDDKNPENILLKKQKNGQFIPILIDGFGAKKLGIKFFIGAFITPYARYKSNKRAQQLVVKMHLDLS